MSSLVFSAFLIAVALFLMFYLSFKGVGLIPIAIICAAVFCLGSVNGFVQQLFTNFTQAAMNYASNMILPVLFGAVFGAMMTMSGCSHAVGHGIMKRVPVRFAPYAIVLLVVVLLMAGLSANWVFVVAPIAFALFEAADIPIIVAAVAGYGATVICAACPGLPQDIAVYCSQAWGISLYAAAAPGFLMVATCLVLLIVYLEVLMRHYKKKGLGYTAPPVAQSNQTRTEDNIPPFAFGIVPIVLMIGLILIFNVILKWPTAVSVITAEVIAMLFIVITCRKYFEMPTMKIITTGALRGAPILIATSCIFGMANCVTALPIYTKIIEGLSNINANPYLLTAIIINVCCALSGGPGGVGVFIGSFSDWIFSTGANMGYVMRIMAQSSTVFDTMPHNVLMNLVCEFFGVRLKDAYPLFIISNIVIPLIATMIGLVSAAIFA